MSDKTPAAEARELADHIWRECVSGSDAEGIDFDGIDFDESGAAALIESFAAARARAALSEAADRLCEACDSDNPAMLRCKENDRRNCWRRAAIMGGKK